MQDELIQKAVADIAANHRKIIDDWCKAYLAQLCEEGHDIKPGCFTLNEQVPTYHKYQDCMVKRYWFEPGIPDYETEALEKTENFIMTDEGKKQLLDLLNEKFYFHKDGTTTERDEQ